MPEPVRKKPIAPSPNAEPAGRVEETLNFFLRFERFGRDLAGVFILTLAFLTLSALLGWTQGRLMSPWAGLLKRWLGLGSFLLPAFFAYFGYRLLRNPDLLRPPSWGRIFSIEIAAIFGLVALSLLQGNSLARAESGLDGGLVGWSLGELLQYALPGVLGLIVVLPLFLLFFILSIGNWRSVISQPRHDAQQGVGGRLFSPNGTESGVSISPVKGSAGNGNGHTIKKPVLPQEFRKKFQFKQQEEKPAAPRPRDEHLPNMDLLLDERIFRPDEHHINTTAGLIEKTLAEFGVQAKVIGFQVGPTVTQFAVEPGFFEKTGNAEEDAIRQKVRVSQITGLSKDLALALSAQRLRIEAPVPGRAYLGIEVPNSRTSLVRLRPILETEVFQKLDSPLAIALGRDVSGRAMAADLSKMPHLLIAGTTGSGKSVCIAAITACLVMNNTPEDLRLVMIDPKMVELVRFNGLPHLMGKVETNLERILAVLRWTVAEMDRRYKLLEMTHSRHIDSHNRKMRARKGAEVLPRIVVLIDELADLMMSAPEQTEPSLVRLAQLARATGIHLVVATQRPSTDVVTGLIKANFPARLSFSVASSIDSRVILDGSGAESLLGRGDMLFLPPDAPAPIRAQGVMVTDQEIERLIAFWRKEHQTEPDEQAPWEELLAQNDFAADRDDLVNQAIAIVRETKRASASLLQRRLKIGYPRAARLIDQLEELGVIGPGPGGGRDREVLPDTEGEIEE